MKDDDCYQLGYVIKTHGLKGELQLFLDVDNPLEYKNMESMFVFMNNSLVPFFIERIQTNSGKTIVKFEGYDTIEEANPLVSSKLYLPLSNLPNLENGEYYLHQLVGMEVIDKEVSIGTVDQIFEIGPQDLISVIHQGKEVLIPLADGIIEKVDVAIKKIYINLPDGLIDIYLEKDED